ncbi:MAG: hypothetical protein BWY31_01461 [Lentisphaerae bacterium ADurb.Bin242]|nr:MAG: hypothetical protein BWY31_01461 [Lentisphaerae bacterium ADurb.Bin242]
MNARHWFFAVISAGCLTLSAKETVLFQSDFAKNPELKGWTDVHQKTPPGPKQYSVVTENGKTFLKTAKIYFGISHKLSRGITIDDTVKRITLSATLFQPEGSSGHPLGLALSSRMTVAADAGQAFWKLRDSGFQVQGYSHNLQTPNFLAYQVEGKQVKAMRPTAPFNLLTAREKWVTWTLVYDHEKKQIDFFNMEGQTEPYLTLYNVKLDGVMLNSVWIAAWGACYETVRVTAEVK